VEGKILIIIIVIIIIIIIIILSYSCIQNERSVAGCFWREGNKKLMAGESGLSKRVPSGTPRDTQVNLKALRT
jgi:uncharacterized protein YpmB